MLPDYIVAIGGSAGYYAILGGHKFVLLQRAGYPDYAIDIFLRSLAREFKKRAVAVILSGGDPGI